MLKVAMISRSTLFSVKGGDTIQVLQTARYLKALGVSVDVKLTTEAIDYSGYDLLHFFNITRPADILYHIQKSSLPFVVSTIMIDYAGFDKHARKGISGRVLRMFSSDGNEYVKTIFRALLRKDTMQSFSYILNGQSKSIKKVLKAARLVLPNSENEYRRLQNRYSCIGHYRVVVNGIDNSVFKSTEQVIKDEKLVLCVARIEGIKNQLNLIKALNGTAFKLLIIGSSAPNQTAYYLRCRRIAGSNINFINHLPQSDLIQYYEQAKVHVLASWFETTGLSSLEAAAMGCNVVITDKGDAKEYFMDDAYYCDPDSPTSIYAAIEKAALQPLNVGLKNRVISNYNWQLASQQTLEAYRQIIPA